MMDWQQLADLRALHQQSHGECLICGLVEVLDAKDQELKLVRDQLHDVRNELHAARWARKLGHA